MQFVVIAYDAPDALEKRLAVRTRHFENLGKIDGRVLCGGGLLDDAGKMKGSVIVLDFPDRDRLDAYLKTEPYILAGVWEKVTVEPMNVALLNGERVG